MLASLEFLQSLFTRRRHHVLDDRDFAPRRDATEDEQRELEAWLFDRESRWQR
ncbi:MAG: hypothetical protein SFX73_17690 [Kofleriaceae bacterium]|nr:hypothetical protein [Kofleriaceae bacterium]